jgi:putative transposase
MAAIMHDRSRTEGSEPHSSALRRGRWSQAGLAYALTSATAGRQLILWGRPYGPDDWPRDYDPAAPPALVLAPLFWLRDQSFIKLGGFAVMPEHAHVIVALTGSKDLSQVVHSWKTNAGMRINRRLSRTGDVWQHGYYDRCLRSPKEYTDTLSYIHANICRKRPEAVSDEFPYCSAHPRWEEMLDWSWFA